MSWFDDYENEETENDNGSGMDENANEVMNSLDSDTITIPKETVDAVPEMSKRTKVKNDIPVVNNEEMIPEKTSSAAATVIDEECIIEGNIKTTRDIMISGTVNGSIQTSGNVTVLQNGFVKDGISGADHILAEGNVSGNLSAHSIELKSGVRIRGDITASKNIAVDKNCVVIGAVSGENVILEGAVKGDITVKEKLDLKETAIVKGSVTAAALNICPGAILDGACNLTNKKCDYKAIFGE